MAESDPIKVVSEEDRSGNIESDLNMSSCISLFSPLFFFPCLNGLPHSSSSYISPLSVIPLLWMTYLAMQNP